MNKKSLSPLLLLSLLLGLAMLFFTFFQWGWFSDANGFKAYFEIPVSTKSGTLSTLADLLWMAAPFLMIIALFLFFFNAKKTCRLICFSFACLPLNLYALLQILLFLGEKQGHFSLLVTFFFLILSGSLAIASVFLPELRRFAAQLALCHAGIECALVLLSFVFEEKYSQFYFSQLLPMGHYSNFRYSFFLISVFLYYLCYSLCLSCLLFAQNPKEAESILSLSEETQQTSPDKTEELPRSEEEEDGESFLSLEDFGIEK